jgi:hypothetical protein
MDYRERFSEEEIFAFENQLLTLMGCERDDFAEPLWSDVNFVLNALPYFDYKDGFGLVEIFVADNFFDNVFVVCEIIKQLRAVHNYIGVECVLEQIPEHAWYEQTFMFLHNVMCADITALQYAPEDTLTEDILVGALYQVPHQYDFVEEDYVLGYTKIVECVPAALWGNKDFVEKMKKAIRTTLTYVNRLDDLEQILALIDTKIA